MNDQTSRTFELRATPPRAGNTRTVCNPSRAWESREPFDARRLFVDRFAPIREALTRHPGLGVAILAFDYQREPVAVGWIAASLDRTRSAVLGRHSACALSVPPPHASVALRHVLFLVRAVRLAPTPEVRVRAIDLRTGTRFGDEVGRTLDAVTADGSFFLSVEQLRLAVLVTGLGGPLPASGEEAYAALPPRVLDTRIPELPDPSIVGRETTLVPSAGPASPFDRLRDHREGPPAGTISIRTPTWNAAQSVGPATLQRGILVGRYARCEVIPGSDILGLSRVHMMLVGDGEDALVVDTASSNGTWLDGRAVGAETLGDDTILDLGGGVTVRWTKEAR